jgi:hypothetical protein
MNKKPKLYSYCSFDVHVLAKRKFDISFQNPFNEKVNESLMRKMKTYRSYKLWKSCKKQNQNNNNNNSLKVYV